MRPAREARGLALAALLATGVVAGCASTNWVAVRRQPRNVLATQITMATSDGSRISARTMLLLRRYDLVDELENDPLKLLVDLREVFNREPSADKLYSLAELAYWAGQKTELTHPQKALELYGSAVLHSHGYLFDDRFAYLRNPYDPEFRGACDLYNGALESILRNFKRNGQLKPGTTQIVKAADHTIHLTIALRGTGWNAEDFDRFEFVSDYVVKGLKNQYHTYGLGVPLIAVEHKRQKGEAIDHFYPPEMSLPTTAFLRMLPNGGDTNTEHAALLELFDPMTSADIEVAGRRVPLESDLSTPLAFLLNQPQLQKKLDQPTLGLLDPDATGQLDGLFMLEPYQPGKIPVLMVHGLWSSPITWMEMFNDLRAVPEINNHFQFWFYLYPTGQPFWYSAARLRNDLAAMRQKLDPEHKEPALDQLVLVGHSMGGLVAMMQTLESGEDYWRAISPEPFGVVKASHEVKEALGEAFFFHPNPAVRRMITIGTPFRGSHFANSVTAWAGSKLITLPKMLVRGGEQLHRDNPAFFAKNNLIDVPTAIDALSPESPVFPVIQASHHLPSVKYHNVVGHILNDRVMNYVAGGEGDGLVTLQSAHLEEAVSEIVVPAEHSNLHRHPRTVLEVRRILMEHLADLEAFPYRLERLPETPVEEQAALPPVQIERRR
ncbi:MAG TPA: alpha/beta fold hydrolase [Pirellulales bacterium]|nr:alpha/beta fold hydrolase [Pirellulales bacterium]